MPGFWQWERIVSRRKCCCEASCLILEDAFDRSDSTNLGGSWTELDGDWEIQTETCIETTGSGVLRTTKSHPKNARSGYFTVDLINIGFGEKRRLLFDLLDKDNYCYVEHYYYNDAGTGKTDLTLGTVIGGVDTQLKTNTRANNDDEGYNVTLNVCRNRNGTYFGLGEATLEEVYCDVEDPGGRRAGLGNASGGGLPVQFDNFHWEQHKVTRDDCPECGCDCDGYCMGESLTMTIVNVDCTCEELDGLEVEGVGHPLGEGQWQFNFPWQTFPWIGLGASCGNMKTDQMFKLWCPGYGPTVPAIESDCEGFFLCDWSGGQLYNIPGWTTPYCTGEAPDGAFPTDCTCNPFWLKYGPFEIWEECEDPDCPHFICSFEIHITKS